MVQEFLAKRVLFKKYINSGEVPPDAFEVEELWVSELDLAEEDVLLETIYLSVDPYMRTLMKEMLPRKHFLPTSYELGKPLYGHGIGRVLVSHHPDWQPGDIMLVWRSVQWATHTVIGEGLIDSGSCRKVTDSEFPLSWYLGVLGMPGLTAWAGLKMIAQPKEREVAFVDAAGGAVGHVVGQLLKNVYKCRVVGCAGSEAKVELCKELGFDAAFNYREVDDMAAAMQLAMPTGLDIHWENVGGSLLDIGLVMAHHRARFVLCGMVSDYDKSAEDRYFVQNMFNVVLRELRVQGLLAFDFERELGDEFLAAMKQHLRDGKVKPVEDVSVGIENMSRAFIEMIRGDSIGKKVVLVGQDPSR